jgi:hypothetical protein
MGQDHKKLDVTADTTRPDDLKAYFDGCAGCGTDAQLAKNALSSLLSFAQSTSLRGVPVLEDCCVNWANDVMEKWLSNDQVDMKTRQAASKFFSVDTVKWKDTIWGYEHNAIKVTLKCSDPPTVFYLDDSIVGGQGNGNHIFGPSDIPPRYQPVEIGVNVPTPSSILEDLSPWNWPRNFFPIDGILLSPRGKK